jgi:hypothetical protein
LDILRLPENTLRRKIENEEKLAAHGDGKNEKPERDNSAKSRKKEKNE